jgi:glycosyltransferase involved in cell wall biosynthesis
MKIVHVTYARVNNRSDPDHWLKDLDFFTGILDEMAKENIVESVHLMNYSGAIRRNNVLYHFQKISRLDWILPWRIGSFIAGLQPQAVIVHGLIFPWHVLWLRFYLKNSRLLIQHHAEVPLSFPKNFLQRILDRYVAAYMFSAFELAEPWLRTGQIRNRAKVHEVIELSSPFSPPLLVDDRDPRTYIWVGRLDQNKDPFTAVRSFIGFTKHEPSAVLHMVFRGGNLLSEIVELVAKHNLSQRIILHGEIARSEIERWYRMSTFIISTSHYESTGAAVCEGMSCGCIPILTNIPAFRTLSNKGNVGLLFKAGVVEDLLSTLIATTSMDREKEKRKVVEHFRANLSFRAISSNLLKIIR